MLTVSKIADFMPEKKSTTVGEIASVNPERIGSGEIEIGESCN